MEEPAVGNSQNDGGNEGHGLQSESSEEEDASGHLTDKRNDAVTPADKQNNVVHVKSIKSDKRASVIKLHADGTDAEETADIDKFRTDWFICSKCDGKFKAEVDFKNHLKEVHDVSEEDGEDVRKTIRYSCNVCSKDFADRIELIEHLKSSHARKLQTRLNALQQKHYHCEMCVCSFTSVNFLKRHEISKHAIVYDKDSDKIECSYCHQLFDSNHHLTLHQVHKHKTKGIAVERKCMTCPECDMKFFKERQYNVHRKNVHGVLANDGRFHICETCGRSFKRADTLKMHYKSVHLGFKRTWKARTERNFVCEICGNGFLSKGHLKEHIAVKHSLEPHTFQCKLCPRSFIRAGVLEYHENKYHHFKKPYQCERCNKSFYSKFSLHDHLKLCKMPQELQLSCQVLGCPRTFKSKHNLGLHMQAVHSEPALVCDCGTVVRWASSVSKHLRRCVLNKDNLEMAGLIKTEVVESVTVGSNYKLEKTTEDENLAEGGYNMRMEDGDEGIGDEVPVVLHGDEQSNIPTTIAVEGGEIVGEEAQTVEEVIDAANNAMNIVSVQPDGNQVNLQDVYYVILKS